MGCKPLLGDKPQIRVICVSDVHGNFTYDKIYEAVARVKNRRSYTKYRIEDDKGNYYTIRGVDIGRLFLILPD